MTTPYVKSVDWFVMFVEDKKSIMATMIRNMADDINAGYDPCGDTIKREREELTAYEAEFNAELDKIAEMEPSRVNHYCYVKLLKAGAI